MRLDRWDVIGGVGAVTFAAGVWGLGGWPYSALFMGAVWLALAIVGGLGGRR